MRVRNKGVNYSLAVSFCLHIEMKPWLKDFPFLFCFCLFVVVFGLVCCFCRWGWVETVMVEFFCWRRSQNLITEFCNNSHHSKTGSENVLMVFEFLFRLSERRIKNII